MEIPPPPPPPPPGPPGSEVSAHELHDLFATLDKSLRAYRLYQANNPVYQGFIAALRSAFFHLWGSVDLLQLTIEEHGFRWHDRVFVVGEGRDNLAFLFYKDGIRYLTLLPGFEDEVETFLDVIQSARMADQEGDDLVTLLWEKQFSNFQYSYVDVLAQGLEVPRATEPPLSGGVVEQQSISRDVAGETEQVPRPSQTLPPPAPPPGISREDFEETLYFLDEDELVQLQADVQLEWERNIKQDVLNALFDRLEDGTAERQSEILRILRQLLPAYLGRGDLGSTSFVLVELNSLLTLGNVLDPQLEQEVRAVFNELSHPTLLSQLINSIEDGIIDPAGDELGVFLQHLGPDALDMLLRTTETTAVAALRERLGRSIDGLARNHPERVVSLLGSDEPPIVIGAARLLGRLVVTAAAPPLAKLLAHPESAVRLAVVEALIAIHNGVAMEAIQQALEDTDREVRIAAARGLASLRYQPARARLETLLQARVVRDADLTEKIAFFEAYGAVGNADSVVTLDKLLNGKNLLRQKQPPELRACAALALGRMNTPAARSALDRARQEDNAMVRSAVMRALRQEASA